MSSDDQNVDDPLGESSDASGEVEGEVPETVTDDAPETYSEEPAATVQIDVDEATGGAGGQPSDAWTLIEESEEMEPAESDAGDEDSAPAEPQATIEEPPEAQTGQAFDLSSGGLPSPGDLTDNGGADELSETSEEELEQTDPISDVGEGDEPEVPADHDELAETAEVEQSVDRDDLAETAELDEPDEAESLEETHESAESTEVATADQAAESSEPETLEESGGPTEPIDDEEPATLEEDESPEQPATIDESEEPREPEEPETLEESGEEPATLDETDEPDEIDAPLTLEEMTDGSKAEHGEESTEDGGSEAAASVGTGPPSLPEQPDDVRGSRETPDQKLSLQSGQTVGGRFIVERYLGSSGGGISYQCREDETGRAVVIKVLALEDPTGERLDHIRRQIRTASQIRHENLTDILGMGNTEDGTPFVAMDFVEGSTLSRSMSQQRQKGREIGLSEVFHVLAHICEGLKAVHEKMVHGVLTPFNIYVADSGKIQIQNLGFGQVAAQYLLAKGEGPFVESIYVPPEVGNQGLNLSASADMYSLGMITAELLSGGGLPRDRAQARDVAVRIAREFGEGLHRLVATSIAKDPGKRVASPGEFRMGLENAVKGAGVDPAEGLPENGIAVEPAIEIEDDDDELFDIPGPEQETSVDKDSDERYLVRKDGLDYGPFNKEEVLEQLYEDEIDEHTSVLDRATQDRGDLQDFDAFREEVEEYIPKREERLRRERERREEIERKVKKGGKAVLVAGIFAGLVVLALMSYYYFTRPDPERLPVDKAFVSLDYKFLPPPKEFQTVAANEDVLEQIFNPEAEKEEVARRVKQARKRAGGSGGGGGGGAGGGDSKGGGGDDSDVATVDMSKGAGSKHLLTDKEINNIILSDFSALRRCVHKELDDNPSFNGVTVKFYIRPSGTTGGVTIVEKQYLNRPVGRCLVREFRQMKFPAHNAINNKGVTFPLKIRR